MAKTLFRFVALAVVAAAASSIWQSCTFLPPIGHVPIRYRPPISPSVAAVSTALLGASPALAVVATPPPVGLEKAALKLATRSYPLVQSIDWTKVQPLTKYMANTPPSKAEMTSVLEVGMALDPSAVRQAVDAHVRALEAADNNLVTPPANFQEVVVAVAKMLATAPASKVNAVFGTIPSIDGLNADWLTALPATDAGEAYKAFLDVASLVKR